MKNLFLKNKLVFWLGLIIVSGIFLRTFNFSDWLHFELDQSRDAIVVDLALGHGIGNLPLLGPKAAGSFLRLGPAFYNLEYVSAVFFGNTPAGMATLNLIFSILAIPLFYFFSARYFNQRLALLLTALSAVSLFLIMYGRFAWNPNSLPFFILLFFYALLRAVSLEEKRAGWWLILAGFSLGILTQLHFVAFLGIPIIAFFFLLWKKPKIKGIFWIGAFSMLALLYLPVVINESKTGGDNLREFSKVFAKKSESGENTLLEKGMRNYTENALGYFLMTTGYSKAELPKLRQAAGGLDIVCDHDCRDNLPAGMLALALFSFGIAALLWKIKKYYKEENDQKKDFIGLVFLWFGVTSVLFVPIAYDFAPRFFLLVSGLPFIFLGLTLEFLEEKLENKKNIFKTVFFSLALILIAHNFWAINERFSQLAQAKEHPFKIGADKILKEEYRVTLEQQEVIVAEMEKRFRENNFPIYLNSEAFYRRSFLYLLEKRNIPRDDFRNSQNSKRVYRQGNYFLIYPSLANLNTRTEKYLAKYDIVSQKEFGTLILFELKPKEIAINVEQQIFEPEKKPRSASGVPVRCRWNEIFGKCNPDEAEDGTEADYR